jgi:hypothetical protein
MKKEFIDFMYELRSDIQADIDGLVVLSKEPRLKCCEAMGGDNDIMAELRTRRSQLGSLNDTIKKYIDTHSKPV